MPKDRHLLNDNGVRQKSNSKAAKRIANAGTNKNKI